MIVVVIVELLTCQMHAKVTVHVAIMQTHVILKTKGF
jgi:hypothetical protein